REVIMRLTISGILLTSMALATSAAAQTPPTAATVRKVIAATKLPTVVDVPLYFRAQSITLPPGAKSTVGGANSVLYQLSGSTDIAGVGEAKMLGTGDGTLIDGTGVELKASNEAPSTLLLFILSPAGDLDRPTATAPAVVKELYRTAAAIPDLKTGGYDLNL